MTTSPITIRQASLTDLADLAVLLDDYRQFYGRTSDLDAASAFLRQRFEHGQSSLFIAFEGETAVGFTQLYPSFSTVSLARVFILNDLFVHAKARRKGVASQLIQAAAAYAQSLGAVRLSLSTATDNENAQALYQSLGWQRESQFFVYHLAIPA